MIVMTRYTDFDSEVLLASRSLGAVMKLYADVGLMKVKWRS